MNSLSLNAFGHALSGAISGAFAFCILYPLDQIKVRKAVESQSRILTYNIIFDDFIHFRIDNIIDIYRGLLFGIIEQFFFIGIYFFFYQILKSDWKTNYASDTKMEMPWITSLIRGSIAGLLTQIFITPLNVIQLRKQTASNSNTASLTNILSSIYKQNGITGFWSGMKASVLLIINPAIVQLFYRKIRKYLIAHIGYPSVTIHFVSGALSKCIATIICYPLVRIKMNLQAGNESMNNNKNDAVIYINMDKEDDISIPPIIKKRISMSDILQSTISEKSVFGLYNGLTPKLIHSSLTYAIIFASKEIFVVYTFSMMLYLQQMFFMEDTTVQMTLISQ